jgi:hypothetical protein
MVNSVDRMYSRSFGTSVITRATGTVMLTASLFDPALRLTYMRPECCIRATDHPIGAT